MSMIITRERGATRLPLHALEEMVRIYRDGFGMAWVNTHTGLVHLRKSVNTDGFIQAYRDKENQDFKGIFFLNTRRTGDKAAENQQPFSIQDEGLLFVLLNDDLNMEEVPGISQSDLTYSKYKSYELMIADVFRNFCKENENASTIVKWNKFIRSGFKVPGIRLLYVITEGEDSGAILYSDHNDGIYKDGNRIWLSSEIDDLMTDKTEETEVIEAEVVEETENLSERLIDITEKLDDWIQITKRDLINCSLDEIIYLTVHYSYQMAELLKKGETGYDQKRLVQEGIIPERITDDMDCFDCLQPVEPGKFIGYRSGDEEYYLCHTCLQLNGVTKDIKTVH